MGSTNSKCECLWLPGQSGKTRKIQEMIKFTAQLNNLELFDDDEPQAIDIFICSNNRTLVQQTSSRMEEDLYNEDGESDDKIEGHVYSWISGLKKGSKSGGNVKWQELAYEVIRNRVSMIVVCAHKKRFTFLKNLIEDLNTCKEFKKNINIWIDEADASVKLWSQFDITMLDIVKKVTLISATYDDIFKQYGRIKVIPFEKTYITDMYHRIQDSEIILDDFVSKDAFGYLEGVYTKHKADICKPGIRLFAPGDVTRESHEQIANFLNKEGFIVVIINGTNKEIRKPNGDVIQLTKLIGDVDRNTPEEIGKAIARVYHDSDFSKFPFAITGRLCIGRGITFQNERFIFDCGIIPFISNAAEAYQCGCRIAGNIKHFLGYKPSFLITPYRMMEKMKAHENIAINISRIVYEEKLESIGKEEVNRSADLDEDAKRTVPRIFQVDPDIIAKVTTMGKSKKQVAEKEKIIRDVISSVDSNFSEMLKSFKMGQATAPTSENSYKKHITDIERKANAGEKFDIDLSKDEKLINSFNCYIDTKNNRFLIVTRKGEATYSPKTVVEQNPFN